MTPTLGTRFTGVHRESDVLVPLVKNSAVWPVRAGLSYYVGSVSKYLHAVVYATGKCPVLSTVQSTDPFNWVAASDPLSERERSTWGGVASRRSQFYVLTPVRLVSLIPFDSGHGNHPSG